MSATKVDHESDAVAEQALGCEVDELLNLRGRCLCAVQLDVYGMARGLRIDAQQPLPSDAASTRSAVGRIGSSAIALTVRWRCVPGCSCERQGSLHRRATPRAQPGETPPSKTPELGDAN
jgi:hypothetical protein